MNFKEWLLILEELKPKALAFKILGNEVDKTGKPVLSTDPNIIKTTNEFNKIFTASGIPEAQQKNIYPTAAYVYKTNPSVGEQEFSQDLKDYYKFVIGNQLPILSFNDDGNVTGNNIIGKSKSEGNPYLHYADWATIIHTKNSENEDEVKKKFHQSLYKSTGDVSDQELVAKSPDEKIKVYKANAVDKCIILGRGQRFCISQPGNSMFQSYRNTKDSTFYFVYDNTRNDDLKVVVVDATISKIEITDSSNRTDKFMQDPYVTDKVTEITSNSKLYLKYLKEKGVDITVFKNEIRTAKENEEHEKLGKEIKDLAWFKSLTYEEKKNYVGRGYRLSDEQFNFLFTTRSEPLLKQHLSLGIILYGKQLNLVLNDPYFKDLKLNYLNARMNGLPDKQLNIKEYLAMPPKYKQELAEKYGDKLKDYININKLHVLEYINLKEEEKTELERLFNYGDNLVKNIQSKVGIEYYIDLPEDKKIEVRKIYGSQLLEDIENFNLEYYLDLSEDKKTELKKLFLYTDANGSKLLQNKIQRFDIQTYLDLPEDKKIETKKLFGNHIKNQISPYSYGGLFAKYIHNPTLEFTDEEKELINCETHNFLIDILDQPNKNNVKFMTKLLETCSSYIDFHYLNDRHALTTMFQEHPEFKSEKVKFINLLHLLSNYSNQMRLDNIDIIFNYMINILGNVSKYIFMFRKFFEKFASDLNSASDHDRYEGSQHHSKVQKNFFNENKTLKLFRKIFDGNPYFMEKISKNDLISTIKFIVNTIGKEKFPRTTRDLIKEIVGEEGYKSIFEQETETSPTDYDKAYTRDSTREARII